MFKWASRIIDIYLSRKNKNGQIYLFAFVQYTTKGGALKAIAEMNGMVLRGKRMFVGEVKYRRGDAMKNTKGTVAKVTTRHDAGDNQPRIMSVGAAELKAGRQPSDAPVKDPNRTSGFDVLVKEVGGELYREECFRNNKEVTRDRHMTNTEELRHGSSSCILNHGAERRMSD
ncbi:serine/arginine-rich splicing factor SC35-like [Arachis duranensis]|uniref:Serine/arginine-rich splicing factor SC35-like n=1 Tax=Arachis duranensis TaxID=130453 RepID=A0A6P4BAG6_ARADU|nr:serine/arginine-rich splicing factor SC35-like [Arachis duranensis]